MKTVFILLLLLPNALLAQNGPHGPTPENYTMPDVTMSPALEKGKTYSVAPLDSIGPNKIVLFNAYSQTVARRIAGNNNHKVLAEDPHFIARSRAKWTFWGCAHLEEERVVWLEEEHPEHTDPFYPTCVEHLTPFGILLDIPVSTWEEAPELGPDRFYLLADHRIALPEDVERTLPAGLDSRDFGPVLVKRFMGIILEPAVPITPP